MSEINRSLIILKPKDPFLDWARTLDEEDENLTLGQLRDDSTAYLLPEFWDNSDRQEFLEFAYEVLFEEELSGWWTDEAAWPKERDLKMFLEWFEVDFHSMVIDLCGEPLRRVEDEFLENGTEAEH